MCCVCFVCLFLCFYRYVSLLGLSVFLLGHFTEPSKGRCVSMLGLNLVLSSLSLSMYSIDIITIKKSRENKYSFIYTIGIQTLECVKLFWLIVPVHYILVIFKSWNVLCADKKGGYICKSLNVWVGCITCIT